MCSKEKYVSFFKELPVNVNGRDITIEECAMVYDLNLELLIAEFAESWDINQSILNAITRTKYIEFLTDYIFTLPLSKLEESFSIFKRARFIVDDEEMDVSRYIYNSGDDIFYLDKNDILLLLVSNNLHNELMKPLIDDTEYREWIYSLIYYCLDPDLPEPIIIKREEVMNLIGLMDQYRLSFKEFGLLMNHFIKHIQDPDFEDPLDYLGEPEKMEDDDIDEYLSEADDIDKYLHPDNIKF